jgi:hypothetical protein
MLDSYRGREGKTLMPGKVWVKTLEAVKKNIEKM